MVVVLTARVIVHLDSWVLRANNACAPMDALDMVVATESLVFASVTLDMAIWIAPKLSVQTARMVTVVTMQLAFVRLAGKVLHARKRLVTLIVLQTEESAMREIVCVLLASLVSSVE